MSAENARHKEMSDHVADNPAVRFAGQRIAGATGSAAGKIAGSGLGALAKIITGGLIGSSFGPAGAIVGGIMAGIMADPKELGDATPEGYARHVKKMEEEERRRKKGNRTAATPLSAGRVCQIRERTKTQPTFCIRNTRNR